MNGCPNVVEIRDDEGNLVRWERCPECVLEKLDRAVAQNPVLTRTFDLDFALNAGIKITLDDLDCEEFRALKCLRVERDKLQAKKIKDQTKS